MATYVNIRIKENNGKSSTMRVRGPDAVTDAQIDDLVTRVDQMTLGVIVSVTKTVDVTLPTYVINPANVAPVTAQRGVKWLISGVGSVDKDSYELTVPTANPALLTVGSDTADPANAVVAPFITALQAIWVDEGMPAPGAVTVQKVRYRNYPIQ